MEEIIMRAPAKINWTLDILGKRGDGYHDIATIMQSVAIYDEIYIARKKETTIGVKVSNPNIPEGRTNIGYRAAQLVLETFKIRGGIDIYIDKNIPAAAGMGGGSSDAGAIILGLHKLYGLEAPLEELLGLGKAIGADVPFCMMGGTALAEGIGEQLTRLPDIGRLWMVIIKPEINVSTAEVYGQVDVGNMIKRPRNEKFIESLYGRDMKGMVEWGGNVLEEVTIGLYPQIESIKGELRSAGAIYSLMSGSGSSVFGVFETQEGAVAGYNKLKEDYEDIFLTHTINTGPVVWGG